MDRLLKPLDFWQVFVEVMRNPHIPDFGDYYNNMPTKKRSRNIRPRTDVMLKNANNVMMSVIRILKERGFLEKVGETSTERYIDVSYATGDWWKGEKYYQLAVEVENDLRELRGTILDLIRFQARMKVAVFYSQEHVDQRRQIEDKLQEVAHNFTNQGFREATDTGYLIVVAPDRFAEGSNSVSQRCVAYRFNGLEEVMSGRWEEESLW